MYKRVNFAQMHMSQRLWLSGLMLFFHARDAFHPYRSHEHEHKTDGDSDGTILSLARVDAWMFVCVEIMKEDGEYG